TEERRRRAFASTARLSPLGQGETGGEALALPDGEVALERFTAARSEPPEEREVLVRASEATRARELGLGRDEPGLDVLLDGDRHAERLGLVRALEHGHELLGARLDFGRPARVPRIVDEGDDGEERDTELHVRFIGPRGRVR